jgi:hypothetical protein
MTNLSEQLETLLSDLLRAHEELLALAHEHRAALSRADATAVQACTARHAELAARIERLELARARLVRALAPASPSPTITSIAQNLPEPARARIIAAAAALKDLLIRVQRELAVLRAATHSLVGHMEGLMQQVARVLTQAGTYGRHGKLDSVQPLPAGLDIRQ